LSSENPPSGGGTVFFYYLCRVKKWSIYLYAVVLGALIIFLRAIEYRFLLRDLSVEVYIGTIAVLFSLLGIWAGWKLTKGPTTMPAVGTAPAPITVDTDLSPREIEVLQLIAAGHSNQEIADKLFLSLNTIKKHNSQLFAKLGAVRRTQAIERAKQIGLLQ
jgi:two-component system, NarL family, response regulator LiaR